MQKDLRSDFFLYVDEFQNFANPSFANILSEARKYRLSLILAHQYIKQLDELVADAVFGNVGTIMSFRVGGPDSFELVKEFTPTFTEEDLVNLPKFQTILKLMIDGVASHPFSAETIPPIGSPTGSAEKIIRISRERYGKKKSDIEDKILRWSGMDLTTGEKDEEDRSRRLGQDPDFTSGQNKPNAPKSIPKLIQKPILKPIPKPVNVMNVKPNVLLPQKPMENKPKIENKTCFIKIEDLNKSNQSSDKSDSTKVAPGRLEEKKAVRFD